MTYSLFSSDEYIQDNIDDYVTALWIQSSHETPLHKHYEGIPCEEVYPNKPPQFQEEIAGQMCPNITDDHVDLQGMSFRNSSLEGHVYMFIVDTCTNLQYITGKNCTGDAEIETQALRTITLVTKISTQFFSPEKYIEDYHRLS